MDFFPRLDTDPFSPWSVSPLGAVLLGFLPPVCAIGSLAVFGLTLDPAAIFATLAVPATIAAGASALTGRNWAWSLYYGLFAPAVTAMWWSAFAAVVAVAEIFGSLPW